MAQLEIVVQNLKCVHFMDQSFAYGSQAKLAPNQW